MRIQTAITAIAALSLAATAHAAQVDVTNGNGTIGNQLLNSYGGLGSTGFQTTSYNGLSLWLRMRDIDETPGTINTSDNFEIDQQTGLDGDLRIDFQFTPKDGDTLASTSPVSSGGQFNNYQLMLQFDSDPGTGVTYATSPKYVVFDDDDGDNNFVKSPNGDIDDRNDDGVAEESTPSSVNSDGWETNDDQEELFADASWDDGDSLVIDGVADKTAPANDGSGLVNFVLSAGSSRDSDNLPEWVVVNSWKPEWIPGGGYTTPTEPGLYDVKITAFNEAGNSELASHTSTLEVVPEPASLALIGLGGLALLRRRRRA